MGAAMESRAKPQGLLDELSRSPRALWARLSDPWVLVLLGAVFAASLAFPRPVPSCRLPASLLLGGASGSSSASRFLIDPYAMPGPIEFVHLSPQAQRDFTLDGEVEVHPVLRSDKGVEQPVWEDSTIAALVETARRRDATVDRKLCPYGAACNRAFFEALALHPVAGQDVLVVGSITPWLEAICLSFGANSTLTVDFTTPLSAHARVRSMSIPELDATDQTFDAVFSYSSLEHDGLGRYGDPINPNGDLERMNKLRGLVRPGGKLYLGVPTGPDFLVFNAHRIYGPRRFPRLVAGWHLLGTYGESLQEVFAGNFKETPECFPEGRSDRKGCYVQPVHVLQHI